MNDNAKCQTFPLIEYSPFEGFFSELRLSVESWATQNPNKPSGASAHCLWRNLSITELQDLWSIKNEILG